jgi:hypothetical protein
MFTPFASIFKAQMHPLHRFIVDIITKPSEGHAPLYFCTGSSSMCAAANAKISGWDILNLYPIRYAEHRD